MRLTPRFLLVITALVAVGFALNSHAQVSILTYQYDNTRAGANTNETILTPANVNTNSFGQLFNYAVDGYVYGQPLVATNVTIPGKGTHNILFVVTEHDSVYAFDADTYVATPYWSNSFINPPNTNTIQTSTDIPNNNIKPEIGITCTPVIDPVAGTIYVEARTREISGGVTSYYHRLHALDITTGLERSNSPVNIFATNYPGVGGINGTNNGQTVFDSDGLGHILWNSLQEQNRPGLALVNGQVIIAYAQPGDINPWHGWLFSYDYHSLTQTGVYCTTPNGAAGGFWMGGGAPAVDTNGFIYANTGNGDFNSASNNYADSYVKFSVTNGLQQVDSFTPNNQLTLEQQDLDVSSAGLILLPPSVGNAAHPNLLLGGSKYGALFLLDTTNLGQYQSGSDSQIVQGLTNFLKSGSQIYSSPAYWNGQFYLAGTGDGLKSFSIGNAQINPSPVGSTAGTTTFSLGATPTISANGNSNGIVWIINNDGFYSGTMATLYAFNATNLSQQLYSSSLSRDALGKSTRFTTAAVANGKVYVPSRYELSVFGNAVFLPPPLISPNGGNFVNSQLVSLSDTYPGAAIYYTLDGTTPTTSSLRYGSAFTLTNTSLVRAIATYPGVANSGVTSASFINTAQLGTGTGLLGSYWSNTSSTTFTNVGFSAPPSFTRIDPTVNFNWNSVAPTNTMARTNFCVSWTGSFQPLYTQTYNISAGSDDGERLWINGQLVIDQWINRALATNTATITLNAQQHYNIRLDYFQGTQNAQVDLLWSSPSTPQAVIPQSQLYSQTNAPPAVALTAPSPGAAYTATATITLDATATTQTNTIASVAFYANSTLLGTLTNGPYVLTSPGAPTNTYMLTAVATDGSGLVSTSAPVNVTVNAGTGQPYGLTSRVASPAFFNMPTVIPSFLPGSLPTNLSQTGVFLDTPSMTPSAGLIPYSPNTPLWSDGALKSRYVSIPYTGLSPETPAQQINFTPTGNWLFPNGTVFVKTFSLTVNTTNASVPLHRLETRLLVRDANGGVYGVTYKWRPDNTDADLLTSNLSENIIITNASGTNVQSWYYPSPNDCLQCHTGLANYVLGVNTRQLNGSFTYPSSGVTDNQLRTLNRLGVLNPAFNEANISNYSQLVSVSNLTADVTNRFRSYIDANCSQCHQPGGASEAHFDARYDTPLASQGIIYGLVSSGLGFDNAHVVTPGDPYRSVLYDRADSVNSQIQMPPLARNLIDTYAVNEVAQFIDSLSNVLALAPPSMTPAGGNFNQSVIVSLSPPDTNAAIYFTLDGSLPTTNSPRYSGAIAVTNGVISVQANAVEPGFNTSVATNNQFIIYPDNLAGSISNGVFQLPFNAAPGVTYILEASTNFVDWIPISTNTPGVSPFVLTDPNATNFPMRFYRAVQSP